jgi:hypothetical protein
MRARRPAAPYRRQEHASTVWHAVNHGTATAGAPIICTKIRSARAVDVWWELASMASTLHMSASLGTLGYD